MLRKLWPLLIGACLAWGNGAAGAADKQLRIGTLAP